jgi:hypothetical protein
METAVDEQEVVGVEEERRGRFRRRQCHPGVVHRKTLDSLRTRPGAIGKGASSGLSE